MSSKQVNNNPGLCPIKGQQLDLCSQIRARDQSPSLSLCTTRTTPQCQMLSFHPAFHLSSYIPPRDHQERLWSNKPLNRAVPCELVGDFISSHSDMPRDPIQPHIVSGGDIAQHLLVLSYQRRRRFGSLKCFQDRLTIRANTFLFQCGIRNQLDVT